MALKLSVWLARTIWRAIASMKHSNQSFNTLSQCLPHPTQINISQPSFICIIPFLSLPRLKPVSNFNFIIHTHQVQPAKMINLAYSNSQSEKVGGGIIRFINKHGAPYPHLSYNTTINYFNLNENPHKTHKKSRDIVDHPSCSSQNAPRFMQYDHS